MNTTKVIHALKRASPTILAFLASLGVVGTATIAVKETPKALKLIRAKEDEAQRKLTKREVFKTAWKCYIPSAALGVSTIICIFGSNALNKKQQAALASAYALVSESYKEYKAKLKELYGEEAHQKIVHEIAAQKYNPEWTVRCESKFQVTTLDWGDDGDDNDIKTFYDTISGTFFESTKSRVYMAEYYINRDFLLGGLCIEWSYFYDLLGIKPDKPIDRVIGYDCEEITWIDFNHWKQVLDDGMEIYYIEPMLDF